MTLSRHGSIITPAFLQPRPIRKWRGANITVKAGTTRWDDFWGASYDLSWITTQVDRAVTLGCNVVRLIGGPNGVVNGSYSRATYLARQQAVLDYIASKNLYYYAALSAEYDMVLNNANRDEIVAHATVLGTSPNVMGFDILQEIDVWASQNATTVGAMSATLSAWSTAVKAAAPSVPVTYSVVNIDPFSIATTVSGYVDFYDFHVYHNSPINWTQAGKRVLIGETGVNQSMTLAEQTARLNKCRTFNDTYALCDGVMVWALADQDTVSSNKWGVFDNSGVERADLTAIWRRIPVTR